MVIQKKKGPKNVQVTSKVILSLFAFILIAILVRSAYVNADPAGVTIISNVTESGQTYSPDNRTDPGGTITTLSLSVTQQNDKWKAYVGNVSGVLTLDDTNGNTIFRWGMSDSEVTGELYASRNGTPGWSTIGCSNNSEIEAEDTDLGFTVGSVDTINNTFNETDHQAIVVAGNTINQNTCRATATFVNSTRETNQSAAEFQEVIFETGGDLVWVTPLNQDAMSYVGEINSTLNHTVDFQILLADDATASNTLYYFFVELG